MSRRNKQTDSTAKDDSCEVIAEAGINHNGDLSIAKELIEEGQNAGVDIVKFQSFKPDEVVTEETQKASYQERSESQNQYEMLDRVTLTKEEHEILFEYCRSHDVDFMSTPYDPDSVELLEKVGVDRYKIASADIVNKPLLEAVVETNKPVTLSTGMAILGEIERAVNFLQNNGCDDLTLLHCVSCYPAEPEQINMRFMKTLKTAFEIPVGFSDHTLGTHVPVAAVSKGAKVIEKHFTLDREMHGPDHFASLEPDELSTMVDNIRDVEAAMGRTARDISEEEQQNKYYMRRSLHTRTALAQGKKIGRENLKIVRPFEGLDPWSIDEVVGKRVRRDVEPNEPLTWEDIK